MVLTEATDEEQWNAPVFGFTGPPEPRPGCGSDAAPPELHVCIIQVEGGGVTPLQSAEPSKQNLQNQTFNFQTAATLITPSPAKELPEAFGLLLGFRRGRQRSCIPGILQGNASQVQVLRGFTVSLS